MHLSHNQRDFAVDRHLFGPIKRQRRQGRIGVLQAHMTVLTEKELQRKKLKGILKAASVAAGFAVSALCVVVAAKGVDKTLDFIGKLFS